MCVCVCAPWLRVCLGRVCSAVCPERPWRFVQVDVPVGDVARYRSRILDVMAPAETIMDLSIAMALWFAARGEGVWVRSDGPPVPYTVRAQVLLLGMVSGVGGSMGGQVTCAIVLLGRG